MKLKTAFIEVVPKLNNQAFNGIKQRFGTFKKIIGGAGGFFMKANQSMQLFQALLNQALKVFNEVKGLTDIADAIGDSADAWGTTIEGALAIRKVFAEKGLGQKETEKMINKLVGAQKEGRFGAKNTDIPIEELLAKLAPKLKGEEGQKVFQDIFGARNLSMLGEFSSFSQKDLEKAKQDKTFQSQVSGVKAGAKTQAQIADEAFQSQLRKLDISNRKGQFGAVLQGVKMQNRTGENLLRNTSAGAITTSVKATETIQGTIDRFVSKALDFFSKVIGWIEKTEKIAGVFSVKKSSKQVASDLNRNLTSIGVGGPGGLQ